MIINSCVIRDEYLYIVSGILIVIMTPFLYRFYRIDPIDHDLILHEQALNLTSQYTNEVRDQIKIETFIEEVRSNEANIAFYNLPPIATRGKSIKDISNS